MTKIEKLTAAQTKSLAAFRDKWLAIGLSTEPANRPMAERAIEEAYRLAGLEPPQTKIWLGSPFAGCVGAALLAEFGKKFSKVGDQVLDQVWDQVRDRVWNQVDAQIGAQVVQAAWGQHDANWLGFYDFFGKHFSLAERAAGLIAIAMHAGWWWPFTGAVIVTERPRLLRRDAAHRLHSEVGPAIEYPDGWGFCAWHGVRIPAEWIEKRHELDPKLALTWPNMEQRTALANILGWDRILSQLEPHVVDADEPHIGELLEVDLPDAPASRFLRVRGPGAHGPNGTYVLGVPREMQTAKQANGWTYGFETYQQGDRT